MFEQKISAEVARKEMAGWLDAKMIYPDKREKYADQIDTLVTAIMYGNVSIDDQTRVITHSLCFPIKDEDGNEALSKLTYKPRLTTMDIQSRVKTGDSASVINGTLSALTGQPAALLGKLDTQDGTIAQAVAVFFL